MTPSQSEIHFDRDLVHLLHDLPRWRNRYVKGVMLSYLLEPTNERRRQRIIVKSAIELLHAMKRNKDAQDLPPEVISNLELFCQNEASSLRSAGALGHYRNKLRREWAESPSRTSALAPGKSDSTKYVHQRGQNHFLEITTVGVLISSLKAGLCVSERGRPTMQAARAYIMDRSNHFPVNIFLNETDIKRAWASKGQVAQLCSAFVEMLKEANEKELSSKLFIRWETSMESFLENAFGFENFLLDQTNFPAQSSIPKTLLKLPAYLEYRHDYIQHYRR